VWVLVVIWGDGDRITVVLMVWCWWCGGVELVVCYRSGGVVV